MQLDRNLPGNDGRGKYALLKLRVLQTCKQDGAFAGLTPEIAKAIKVLEENGILDWGDADTESEFFVVRLKDRYAQDALRAYAQAARSDDPEWAEEVDRLSDKAGEANRWCQFPD